MNKALMAIAIGIALGSLYRMHTLEKRFGQLCLEARVKEQRLWKTIRAQEEHIGRIQTNTSQLIRASNKFLGYFQWYDKTIMIDYIIRTLPFPEAPPEREPATNLLEVHG